MSDLSIGVIYGCCHTMAMLLLGYWTGKIVSLGERRRDILAWKRDLDRIEQKYRGVANR